MNLSYPTQAFLDLIDGIDGVAWEAEYPCLRFTFVGKNAAMVTGHAPEEWLHDTQFWSSTLGLPSREVIDAAISALPEGMPAVPIKHGVIAKNGKRTPLLSLLTAVPDAGGSIHLRGIMLVTATPHAAVEEMKLTSRAFESDSHAMLIVSCEGDILRANKAFSRIFGYAEEEVIGPNTTPFLEAIGQPSFTELFRGTLSTSDWWHGESRILGKHGNELTLMGSVSLIRGDDGETLARVVIFQDITSTKSSEIRLYQLAHFDHLTHLPNRETFSDRMEHAITIASRQKTRLAVLFLDIDHFKTINDNLGHAVGDKVLCVAAARISECLRLSDTVARIGGDEFVVLLEETGTGLGGIEHISQKLCAAVSEVIRIDDLELYLGLSIGISLFPEDGRDSETLLQRADAAMYRAKSSGRSCWRFFDESMARQAARRLNLQTALRRAVERNELTLHYQPQRSLHTGQVVGVEALARWNRPGEGMIPPAEFIPITEESSLIISIGTWALQTACMQAAFWRAEHGLSLRIGVNITAKQIRQPEFVETVARILQETGLPPDQLELEITESSILDNIDEAITKLRAIKALGISLAIDDFGTGYSSLSYLKRLPIDRLKIDQSFVRDTPGDPDDCAIVRTIIAMAENLGLSVIAEGVESREQSDFLAAEGCDEIQGFFLAQPLPAAELASRLINGGHLMSS